MAVWRYRWIVRVGLFVLLGLVCASLVILFSPRTEPARPSNYTLTSQSDFNQPDFYPVQQNLNPAHYKPVADWVGRLILPSAQEQQSVSGSASKDWVWIEVYQAPAAASNLVGQVVPLSWRSTSLKNYVDLVTTDIHFSQTAQQSERRGNVLPTRLDGRSQVGPLQSLAGAHPRDDVLVSLADVAVSPNPESKPLLEIAHPPIQVPARYYSLVKIVSTVPQPADQLPKACPGSPPCPSELFQVQHYNPQTDNFEGALETIRIPQQPPLRNGGFASTPRQLIDSPVGQAGWYLYGAADRQGLFTVQAIAPRSLFQLASLSPISEKQAGLHYIHTGNWQNTPERKGKAESVLLQPPKSEALNWQIGDRALLMHSFGGIGGATGDQIVLGTVTGHFAYGLAEVVRDPFTGKPRFDLHYEQVYAHNPEGIIAGPQSWAMFMGNLQRGWLNNRPVSDVILKLDSLADFRFGDWTLSPLSELVKQLQIMAARYRTGDGTGDASVTPAASCVQDSNQALYIAIAQLQHQVKTNAAITTWLQSHPNDPQTARFQRLVALGRALEAHLVPSGVVRSDWQANAQFLAGISDRPTYPFLAKDTLGNALLSWQTVVPRRSYDVLSQVFLEQGASLWFIRTNQVGGQNPEIYPLAPTLLFGDSWLSLLLRRSLIAGFTLPNLQGWLWLSIILVVYGAIALPLGLKTGFLHWSLPHQPLPAPLKAIALLFLAPALLEEWLFRVLLLPAAVEGVTVSTWIGWATLSLLLFIVYHPLNALTFYPRGKPTFFHPVFLTLTGLLGIACTVAYGLTGSLWSITLMHGLVVIVWLFVLGGNQQLGQKPATPSSSQLG